MDVHHIENQIDAYIDNCLDYIETLRFERHLKNCSVCHERLEQRFLERGDTEGLPGVFGKDTYADDCLNPSTIEQYVEGKLSEEEIVLANRHLETCYDCFAMVEEYWQYCQTGKIIWLSPSFSPPLAEMLPAATELYEDSDVKQLAAYSASEAFDFEKMHSYQDEAGSTQVRMYLDEEDHLQVSLLHYDSALQGQKIKIVIPTLHKTSDVATLTGGPVEWNLGTVTVTLSGPPDIQLSIIPEERPILQWI